MKLSLCSKATERISDTTLLEIVFLQNLLKAQKTRRVRRFIHPRSLRSKLEAA